jgi:3-oxoacyl-[acyl-carrier protein] reductase
MPNLKGKVAIVTGASKGIGAAIAEDLAREGASVIVNYSSSPQKAEEVVGRIKANGGSAKAVRADVSKPAEARQLIDATLAEFGRADILVNNAGVYEFRPLPEVDEAHFDRMFDVNVKGLVFATQAAVKAFGENGGTVINISSMASLAATPNGSVYSATKAAVDSVTRTLAAELGPKKILVNSVLPGPVETAGALSLSNWDESSARLVQQTPLGRVGKAGRYRQSGFVLGVRRCRLDHGSSNSGGRRVASLRPRSEDLLIPVRAGSRSSEQNRGFALVGLSASFRSGRDSGYPPTSLCV